MKELYENPAGKLMQAMRGLHISLWSSQARRSSSALCDSVDKGDQHVSDDDSSLS